MSESEALEATTATLNAKSNDSLDKKWGGGEWFGEMGFDAYLLGQLLDREDLMSLSARQLWIVKLKVIDELIRSSRIRRLLRKAAKEAIRSSR